MDHIFQLLLAFSLSLFLVYITVPVIVRLSKEKKLFDIPNERKVNTTVIPNLGGVSIFIGISLASLLSIAKLDYPDLRYILVALIIMFFTGIKDDILIISPKKKFILQILSALILAVLGDIRFTNLHGLFGISAIGYVSSILFSVLAIVSIINSINLIDGIDGLASGLGILISMFFGLAFAYFGHPEYSILSFATLGSLIPFFLYNVFGKKNKIYMGDTGALILGVLFAVFVIKFNEFALSATSRINSASPVISLAILFVPLLDMVRVFCLRMSKRKSPFSADKNHIHHKYLELKFSHVKSTVIIVLMNLFFTLLSLFFIRLNIHVSLILLLVIGLITNYIPDFILMKRARLYSAFREFESNKVN